MTPSPETATPPTHLGKPRLTVDEVRKSRHFYALVRYFFRVFYSCVGRFTVEGAENIPKSGPVIFAPNHASFLDPPFVGCGFSRSTWFFTKDELFHHGFLRWFLPKIQAFPVRRGAADRAALKKALEILTQGETLSIFPEGERTRDGNLHPPAPGVGMIALKSRATVIPVGIFGTYEMLPTGAKRLKRGQLGLKYGPPVPLSDLYGRRETRELQTECANRIMVAIADVLGVPPPLQETSASPSEGALSQSARPAASATP